MSKSCRWFQFCCYVVLPVSDILYAISQYVDLCNPPEIDLQSNIVFLVGVKPVRYFSYSSVLPEPLDSTVALSKSSRMG